jgi:hypothetical protein
MDVARFKSTGAKPWPLRMSLEKWIMGFKWGQIPIIEAKVKMPFNWNLTPNKNQNKK